MITKCGTKKGKRNNIYLTKKQMPIVKTLRTISPKGGKKTSGLTTLPKWGSASGTSGKKIGKYADKWRGKG